MVNGKSRKLNRGGPCVLCGATQSTLFRRSPEGTMCNPCGLRHKRQLQKQQRESAENIQDAHSEQLSHERCVSEDTAQVLVENRHSSEPLQNEDQHEEPNEERKVCSLCYTDTSPLWRAVDGNLACNKCALRARRKGKRQSDALTEVRPLPFSREMLNYYLRSILRGVFLLSTARVRTALDCSHLCSNSDCSCHEARHTRIIP
jgi:GATA zinc finger